MNEAFLYLSQRIKENNGCWEFTSFICVNGYGICGSQRIFDLIGERRAHRIAYKLTRGSIPKGLHICHKCDNRKCIHPDHLFAGTQLDNMLDCKRKGRKARLKGEENPFSRLTNKDVLEIKQLKGFLPGTEVAKMYGMGKSMIYYIWQGKWWSHI